MGVGRYLSLEVRPARQARNAAAACSRSAGHHRGKRSAEVVRREPASKEELLTLLKPGFDNLKIAKTLGLTMPLSLLGRADLAIVRHAVLACLTRSADRVLIPRLCPVVIF